MTCAAANSAGTRTAVHAVRFGSSAVDPGRSPSAADFPATRSHGMSAPNASYSIAMRVQLDSDAGGIRRITTAVEEAAGTVIAVDVVESHHDRMVVDLTCNAAGERHAQQITEAVDLLDGVTTHKVSDRNLSLLPSTALLA